MKSVKLTDKQIEFIEASLGRQGVQGFEAAETLVSIKKAFDKAKGQRGARNGKEALRDE